MSSCRLINLDLSQVLGAATGSYWLQNFDGNYTFKEPNYTNYVGIYGMPNWLITHATFSTSSTNGGFTLSNVLPANAGSLPLDPCAQGVIQLETGSYSLLFATFSSPISTYSTYFFPLSNSTLSFPATFSATASTNYYYGVPVQNLQISFITTANYNYTWTRNCYLNVDGVNVSSVAGITGGQFYTLFVPQIYSPSVVEFRITATQTPGVFTLAANSYLLNITNITGTGLPTFTLPVNSGGAASTPNFIYIPGSNTINVTLTSAGAYGGPQRYLSMTLNGVEIYRVAATGGSFNLGLTSAVYAANSLAINVTT